MANIDVPGSKTATSAVSDWPSATRPVIGPSVAEGE